MLIKFKDRENLKPPIDVLAILEYLKNNVQSSKLLAKRIPVLTCRWMDLLDDTILQSIPSIIIHLLINSDDYVIKYNCCLCLKRLAQRKSLVLNYADIIEEVSPVIMDLLEKLFSCTTLWHLIQFLTTLIERAQYTCGERTLKIIQLPAMRRLMESNEEVIRGALIDMFKNLVVSFPNNVQIKPIFAICINFIDTSLTLSKVGIFFFN
jgi:hypothetical protein